MTAVPSTPRAEGRIRPLDPFRDLVPVVDLITVAFGERLDPAGKATLARLRRFADFGPLLQWVWALLGRAAMAPGLVWVADDQVVGNVSVRRARGSSAYLIGNVVVHPDWRGQGIASALMKRAITLVSRRRADWVGLEVRVDNEVARGLYERLGFQEVGRTHHLLRSPDAGRVDRTPRYKRMRRGRGSDGDALVQLMRALIPEEQRPLLEVQEADYRPSCSRRVDHWLRFEDEVWWVVAREDETTESAVGGAVRVVRKAGAFPNQMELLVWPGSKADVHNALVKQGVASLMRSSRKPIEVSVPEAAGSLSAALTDEGFQELRVLIQMKRSLGRKVPVRARS